MKHKKLYLFLLVFSVLFFSSTKQEVKAEEYLTLQQAVQYMKDTYGYTYPYLNQFISTGSIKVGTSSYYLSSYPYYVFLDNNVVYVWNSTSYSISSGKYNFSGRGFYFTDSGQGSANSCTFTSSDFINTFALANFEIEGVQNEYVAHNWVSKTTAATCTSAGRSWEECSDCGAIQNDTTIPALGHSWTSKTTAATCTSTGRSWQVCSRCNATQNSTTIAALGHNWISKTTAATCTSTGRSWEQCSRCNSTQNSTTIAALGHHWVSRSIAATCTTDGSAWEECSTCNATQNNTTIPALGHGILIYQVTQQPTLSQTGTFTESCSVCGVVINTGTLPMLTPIPTPDPALMAQSADYFSMYVIIMDIMKEFPLNLFIIACLMYIAILLFYKSKKSIKSKG